MQVTEMWYAIGQLCKHRHAVENFYDNLTHIVTTDGSERCGAATQKVTHVDGNAGRIGGVTIGLARIANITLPPQSEIT